MYRFRSAVGDTRPVVMTCPTCSYLLDGSCHVCSPDEDHPACEGCVDGHLPAMHWYESDLAQAIMAGVAVSLAVSVATALLVPRIERALGSSGR